jgi:uncharacterized protein (DUF3820 family)
MSASTKLWFGKHKGKTLAETPTQYLEWCLKERVGGGELVSDIAAFLMIPEPKKRVKYDGKSITRDALSELQRRHGFHTVNAFCDGVDIMGVSNCHDRFDDTGDWPHFQEWDGNSPPWANQCENLDIQFKDMFR